jgi:hypothetical protein
MLLCMKETPIYKGSILRKIKEEKGTSGTISFYLNKKLYAEFKEAIGRDLTISEVIQGYMRDVVEQEKRRR